MKKEIDARGLACPQPVILTKKALENHDDIVVTVDNEAARENVKRMAQSLGCSVSVRETGGAIHISISREHSCDMPETASSHEGPLVVVIASDTMGRGNDELGTLLMKSFIHTIVEMSPLPDTLIFFNTGVKLTVTGSEVIDDLKILSDNGVNILVCGTCLGYFDIKDQLATGIVSNMYDIAETMMGAGRLVQI